jgi:hypothetical protein
VADAATAARLVAATVELTVHYPIAAPSSMDGDHPENEMAAMLTACLRGLKPPTPRTADAMLTVTGSTVEDVIDLEDVIQDLLHVDDEDDSPRPWRTRSDQRLGPGVVRLEYDEDDSIFVVTVERLPIHRPAGGEPVAVGTLDGLTLRITGVTVETELIVRLDIADSERRQALGATFDEEFEAWVQLGRHSGETPPACPASAFSRSALRSATIWARSTKQLGQFQQSGLRRGIRLGVARRTLLHAGPTGAGPSSHDPADRGRRGTGGGGGPPDLTRQGQTRPDL